VTIYIHAELSQTSQSVAKFLRDHPLEQYDKRIEVKVIDRAQALSRVDPKYTKWTAKQFVAALKNDKMRGLVSNHNDSFRNDQVHVFVTPLDEQSFYEMQIVSGQCGHVIVLVEGVFSPVFMLADHEFEVFASREDLLKEVTDYFKE